MAKRSRKSKFDAVDRAHVRGGTVRTCQTAGRRAALVRPCFKLPPSFPSQLEYLEEPRVFSNWPLIAHLISYVLLFDRDRYSE